MPKPNTKEIFSSVESFLRWEEMCRLYSKSQLIQACELSLTESPYHLVQTIKVFDYFSEYDSRRDDFTDQMRRFIQIPKQLSVVQQMKFQGRGNSPTKILLLCGWISEKVKSIVSRLAILDIPCRLACISNFKPDKPYQLAEGTWYPVTTIELSNYEQSSAPVDYYNTEMEFSSVADSFELHNTLTICMGTGLFSADFIQLFPNGLINVHNAFLPGIRGLDSPAWSLLSGMEYGISLHLINQHVDLGERITTLTVPGGAKHLFDSLISSTVVKLITEVVFNKKWPLTVIMNGGMVFPMLGARAAECLTAAAS